TQVSRNGNIAKLQAGYLFPEAAYMLKYPDAKVISLEIGDTTEPIPEVITCAMAKGIAIEKLSLLAIMSHKSVSGQAQPESDTSIGEDIEETSAYNDSEIEESAEKYLEVNGPDVAEDIERSEWSDNQLSGLVANEVVSNGDGEANDVESIAYSELETMALVVG
ncbi:LL-diaminopimelate aminotransferase, chloroplastic, partial [Tanacetum coccineum]